jgi:phospholipid/cholesterol/gamma-HCH transport system substrate-binding protein
MSNETKVGVFVIVGILMLFGLSTQVGTFQFGEKTGYHIIVQIDDANGVEKNAKVKSRGITIGSIEEFSLLSEGVNVTLLIDENIKIPKNSIVSVKQESMLGVKYIEIEFSNEKLMLGENEKLSKSKTYASFDQTSDTINKVAITIDDFIKRLDNVVASNEDNFAKLIENFKEVGVEFRQVGKEVNIMSKNINKKLPSILTKFEGVGREFELSGKTINKSLPDIMTKFQKLEDTMQVIMDENKDTLKSAIKNVDTAFVSIDKASAKVETSFDKLDKYLSSTANSKLGVEFKTQLMQNDSFYKTYFGVDYSPKPTIHYLVDIVSTDDYRDDGTGTGNPVATEIHEKGLTLISAQYAKDLGNLRVRAGLIENRGSVGMDYFMENKQVKLSLDAYDFNAYNDVRGDNVHLNTQLEYTFKKHILLYLGYDNFINKKARTAYFGVGVRFEDDDLKYLIGSAASK